MGQDKISSSRWRTESENEEPTKPEALFQLLGKLRNVVFGLDFTEEIFLPDVKEEEVSSKVLKKGRKKWESGSLVGFISDFSFW